MSVPLITPKDGEKKTYWDGIYIVAFDDNKYRVSLCRDIDNIQSGKVYEWTEGRTVDQTFYISMNFNNKQEFEKLSVALDEAKRLSKIHPTVQIIYYPGVYPKPVPRNYGAYC